MAECIHFEFRQPAMGYKNSLLDRDVTRKWLVFLHCYFIGGRTGYGYHKKYCIVTLTGITKMAVHNTTCDTQLNSFMILLTRAALKQYCITKSAFCSISEYENICVLRHLKLIFSLYQCLCENVKTRYLCEMWLKSRFKVAG